LKPIKLLILGSTGSIGTQTLDIVRANPTRFEVAGLSANRNCRLLAEQIAEFRPEHALIADSSKRPELLECLASKAGGGGQNTEILCGEQAILELSAAGNYDVMLNALVGFAGFEPTVAALNAGKKVALANKESLVVGGELLKKYTAGGIKNLIPVDSEHSAILQCLVGEEDNPIEKLLITASGGPFRCTPLDEMSNIRVEDALKHPNWDMGAKITIDSATMMNKGLEIIEAYWLYDVSLSQIEPVIHPQSIIHSMVTFSDSSTKAQLGYPDMKVPIQYALTWPARIPLETPRMDFSSLQELNFQPVEYQRFPCLKLALDALDAGAYAPAVLNAANEIAVQRFLNKNIGYTDIARIVEQCLNHIHSNETLSVETLGEVDRQTREMASRIRL
jgi:1-deoxy-D-xylulose-5-phosphate reductoisomerase